MSRETELAICLTDALADAGGWKEKAASLLKHNGEWACFVEAVVGEEPDKDCVLDYGAPGACVYASCGDKHKCKYWAPKTDENLHRATTGETPVK